MTNFDDPITISHGMHVYGSDGEKVGTVEDMRGNTMVVSKGWFFPTEHYIPTSAINSVDGDRVYLTVTRDEALNQGWDVEPVMDETVVTETPIVDAGLQIQNPVPNVGEPMATGVAVGEVEETDWVADTTADTDSDNLATGTVEGDEAEVVRVPLAEEELTATTRGVERGEVQVQKVVSAEEQTLEVPVTEEHVQVTRRIVDRDAAPGDQAFEEITIEMPVYGEEVDVDKRAHVREEVEIRKETTTSTERVSDTVRREDVQISDTDDVVDDNSNPRS